MTQLHNAAFWSLELITFFALLKKKKEKMNFSEIKRDGPDLLQNGKHFFYLTILRTAIG